MSLLCNQNQIREVQCILTYNNTFTFKHVPTPYHGLYKESMKPLYTTYMLRESIKRKSPPPFSQEHRRKMSVARKGKMPKNISSIAGWNRGTKGIMKPNITSFKSGEHTSPETEFRLGQAAYNKGVKPSLETRKKISEAHKGKPVWNKGKKNLQQSGERHWNWKGGITPSNHLIRNSFEYKLWRKAVFERDNFTCRACGKVGGVLNADHIKPFAWFPELRFAIDNGRTLCVSCHRKTDTYGYKSRKL